MIHGLLSIIMPAYNVEDYIERAIDSILKQTYSQIELIIVDDGSTDNTLDIISARQKMDKRIIVVSQKNKGAMSARNEGIRIARGQWITFIDSDDYIEINAYRELINKIGDNDMITYGVYREISPDKNVVRTDLFEEKEYRYSELEKLKSTFIYDFERQLMQPLTPWIYNKIYKTDKMKQVALRCDNVNVFYAEDSILLYSYVVQCESIIIIREPHYHYTYHKESVSHRKNYNMLENINNVYRYFLSAGNFNQLNIISQLQKWLSFLTCNCLKEYMDFSSDNCPIQFILDTRVFQYKKIVLYGAGRCGQDYMKQFIYYNVQPVIWIDENYKKYNDNLYEIQSPEEIKNIEYDIILIAVSEEINALGIKEKLKQEVIEEDKIYWRKPMKVYG